MKIIQPPPPWDDGSFPVLVELEDGTQLGVQSTFIYTHGLIVNPRFDGGCYNPDARYCYAGLAEACLACIDWDGKGDPPGNWIKEKFSERLGPGALKEES